MDTTAPNLSEHPWMEHIYTRHRAQLPDIPYWRANGWNPCDGPPPEPDLTRDEPPAPSPSAGSSAVQDDDDLDDDDAPDADADDADESAEPEDGEN